MFAKASNVTASNRLIVRLINKLTVVAWICERTRSNAAERQRQRRELIIPRKKERKKGKNETISRRMPTRLSPLSRGNMFCRDVWPLFRGLTGPDLSTRRNVTWKKREKINNNNNNKKKVKEYVTCGTYDLRNTWNSPLLLKIYNRVAVPVNQISRATWIGGWRGWFCAGERSLVRE